jgi:hypothetical protein
VSSAPSLYSPLLGVVGHGFEGHVLPLLLPGLVSLVSRAFGVVWFGFGRDGGCVLGTKLNELDQALKLNACSEKRFINWLILLLRDLLSPYDLPFVCILIPSVTAIRDVVL